MTQQMEDALKARGRRWGERNHDYMRNPNGQYAGHKQYFRPGAVVLRRDPGVVTDCFTQCGRVTRIPPAE